MRRGNPPFAAAIAWIWSMAAGTWGTSMVTWPVMMIFVSTPWSAVPVVADWSLADFAAGANAGAGTAPPL